MLCADPTRCSPRRPCRISSRTRAIGSRADSPPPSATMAPSPTRDTASARLARLSRGGCRLMGSSSSARDGPGRLDRGRQHRVVDRRERRRVAEVEPGDVGHAHPGVQRGGQHVDPLRRALRPASWPPSSRPVRGVHQPDVQRLRARVVLGPGPGHHIGGPRRQPGRPRLGQPQPGARHFEVEHLDHRRAHDPAERRGPARRDRARHPAGLVGGRPERHPGGRPAPGAAARRSHRPRTRRAARCACCASTSSDRSGRCSAPAWISRSLAGPHPGRDHHQSVPISAPSTTAVTPRHARLRSARTASSRAPSRTRACRPSSASDHGGDRLVHGAEDARQRLDDLDLDARADQGLGRLQADIPGADHDGPADGAVSSSCRSSIASSRDRIVNTRGLSQPRHRRPDRIGPAGHDQRVVAERPVRRPRRVRCTTSARPASIAADPGVQPQVDAAFLAELTGRVGQQALRALAPRRRGSTGCRTCRRRRSRPASQTTTSRSGATRRAADAADIPAAPPPITTSRATCAPSPRALRHDMNYPPRTTPAERACGQRPGGGQVLPGQRTGPGSTRQISGISRRNGSALTGMSEHNSSRAAAGCTTRSRPWWRGPARRRGPSSTTRRSRWTSWSPPWPGRWCARTAPRSWPGWRWTRAGSATTPDKVAKINKRVTGVLADMAGLRTVGVVEEQPTSRAGEDRQAGRRGRGADPDHRPGRDPAGQGAVRAEGPERHHLRAAPADHRGHRGRGRLHAGRLRAGRRARRPGAVAARAVAAQDPGADAPGRPGGGHRRRGHGQRRVQLRHPGLRGGRRQRRARGGRDRRPGRRGGGHPRRQDVRLRHQLPGRQRGDRARGRLRRPDAAADRRGRAPVRPGAEGRAAHA